MTCWIEGIGELTNTVGLTQEEGDEAADRLHGAR